MPNSSRRASQPPRLPRAFGWLVRLVTGVTCYRSQLQHLLSDPEIEALVSAAPQMGRMLRPLCHMLAIRVPEFLARIPAGHSQISAPAVPGSDRASRVPRRLRVATQQTTGSHQTQFDKDQHLDAPPAILSGLSRPVRA